MRHLELLGLLFLSVALLAGPIGAADRVILGKKLLVRDPTGAEPDRVTIVLARETGTDVPSLAGNPTVDGATLRIVTNGMTPSDEYYYLPSFRWSATSSGFVFRSGGGDPDPIRRAHLKRTPGGVAVMKLVLRGDVGAHNLDVVPPDPGTGGAAVLSLRNGGDRYCASYGGAAAGTIGPNTASIFKVKNPTGQPPCPPEPSPVCCDFGTQQQVCAWAASPGDCIAATGNVGDANSVCDSATGLCTPPPADPGYCCEGVTTVFNTNCGAGPTVVIFCEGLGGTLFSSAVCTTSGNCASPSGAFVDPAPEPF